MNKVIQGRLTKSTKESSGYDMYSQVDVTVNSGYSVIIPTGVIISLDEGYEAQVRGRSGLTFRESMLVPIGTVDSDYKDEIKVKFHNMSNKSFEIKKGDRIAQLVIGKRYDLIGAEELFLERNGGFGSTGK